MDKIVASDKFKHSDEGFRYFIGYKEGEIIKPLCIILPKIRGYIKYFENGGKNMSFIIKDDALLDKYNEISNKIKRESDIKIHSMPVYDEKYIKAKVRKFNGVIKGNQWSDKRKRNTYRACITIDSVIKMKKKLSTSLFRSV